MLPSLTFAQVSPAPLADAPLDSLELREILLRLQEYRLLQDEIELRVRVQGQTETLTQREQALAARELEMEKERTALAQRETAIEKARADFYQSAFEAVSRKRSGWCWAAKIFTFGLARCG